MGTGASGSSTGSKFGTASTGPYATGGKFGTGATGASATAMEANVGEIDVVKETGGRHSRGSIITGTRYDPLVHVGSSTTGGVEPSIARELAEEKKLILQ